MQARLIPALAGFLVLAATAFCQEPAWHFEYSGGRPAKIVWQTKVGLNYDLFHSPHLAGWERVNGFPKPGTGSSMEHPFIAGERGFFKIATQTVALGGMVLIPAGSFQMGDTFSEGETGERPVHGVTLRAFSIQNTEVTKAQWDTVATWAASNGYDITVSGGSGVAADHPVHNVTWYEVVKYCNARSQMEGLTLCYTLSGATVKTGTNSAVACNWSANGYRLPTEAEWEKAARGGLAGKRFPWGDTITHSEANYRSSTSYAFDISPTRGYHPTYNDGSTPYTSPVGSFAPNGYELYDMIGNVWEWCWDWYGSGYFISSPANDPLGPASGSLRVIRGGSWYDNAFSGRVALRLNHGAPGYGYTWGGFRVARSSVPLSQQER